MKRAGTKYEERKIRKVNQEGHKNEKATAGIEKRGKC